MPVWGWHGWNPQGGQRAGGQGAPDAAAQVQNPFLLRGIPVFGLQSFHGLGEAHPTQRVLCPTQRPVV